MEYIGPWMLQLDLVQQVILVVVDIDSIAIAKFVVRFHYPYLTFVLTLLKRTHFHYFQNVLNDEDLYFVYDLFLQSTACRQINIQMQ